jgi:ribosomal protein S18 acetylase RimI-like enzyme
MEVRKAKPTELPYIVSFQQKMAMETESLELDTDILNKGVQAVFDDSAKGTYYVAVENDNIIGSLMITYEWSDWRNGQVYWIQSVYVLPEHRGKGVYKQMYLHLKEQVEKTPGIRGLRLYVEKDNVNAQKVYSKLGMDGEHYKMFEWMVS